MQPGYFKTMEIPLVLGRVFDERDTGTASQVAVVNRAFATQYFGGSSPIGQRFWFGTTREGLPIAIVGMVRDAHYADLRAAAQPTVYVPLEQDVPGQASFAVRTTGDPLALAPAVRRAVAEVDPALPLFDVRSQHDQAQQAMARETLFARLSSLLGGIALLLVAIGLYGTLSYTVLRRTSEIGVRMALGARRTAVVGMVLRDAADHDSRRTGARRTRRVLRYAGGARGARRSAVRCRCRQSARRSCRGGAARRRGPWRCPASGTRRVTRRPDRGPARRVTRRTRLSERTGLVARLREHGKGVGRGW